MRQFSILLITALLFCACGPDNTKEEDPKTKDDETLVSSEQVISLSDIHFDPFFDKALYPALFNTDIDKWDSIFNLSTIPPTYLDRANDDDTNWFLFKSTLEDLKTRKFSPPFLIVTGDLLLHNMQAKFKNRTSEADKLSFTVKTMDYVYQKLEETFPNTPIYAALGNNDNLKGNYSIEPGGDFLKGIADTWYRSLKTSVDSSDFYKNFLARGNYAATLKGNAKHKILSINSILFYYNYPRTPKPAGPKYKAAIQDQFTWLEGELKAAKLNGDKVWLIYHIPPGVDTYQTADNTSYVPNWSDSSNNRFISLVSDYPDVITAQFGGHTHKDSFALIRDDSTQRPVSFIHTTPSISMSNSNYPGYHNIKVTTDFEVSDYDAYYLKGAETYSSASWEKEYSFLSAYGISEYTPTSLEALRVKLNTDMTLQNQYMKFFNVSYYEASKTPNINKTTWKAYWCAMGYQNFSTFDACWK